jgi:hypothetical protein
MSADGKPTRGRTRSLTDSARKRNGREVLVNYNKARIGILTYDTKLKLHVT